MVSKQRYEDLVSDRPKKFTALEIGFIHKATDEHICGACWHFYKGKAAKRTVCEIYEGKGEDRKVPAAGSCSFWTNDGTNFPKLAEGKKTPEPPKEEHAEAA